MKHNSADDATKEMAALYALGALTQLEAAAFDQHLTEGCEACRIELRAFDSIVVNLGLGVAQADPPATLREKLLGSIRTDSRDQAESAPTDTNPQLLTIRADEGEWMPAAEGVSVKTLFADEASGTVTTMVKMSPGARLPMHRHLGIEQCLMLDGDFHVNDQVFHKGDYHCAKKGSLHETLFTENGALFLIVSQKGFEVVRPS